MDINDTLTPSLVKYINTFPEQLKQFDFTTVFFEKNNRPYYRIEHGDDYKEGPWSCQQIDLDIKALGASDSNTEVYSEQLESLFASALGSVIPDYINLHVNADTYEVLNTPETKVNWDLDTGNDQMTFAVQIKDPINQQAFNNIVSVCGQESFTLNGEAIEKHTQEEAPLYTLTLVINTDVRN